MAFDMAILNCDRKKLITQSIHSTTSPDQIFIQAANRMARVEGGQSAFKPKTDFREIENAIREKNGDIWNKPFQMILEERIGLQTKGPPPQEKAGNYLSSIVEIIDVGENESPCFGIGAGCRRDGFQFSFKKKEQLGL
jgi:hypothetical protein